MLARSIHHEKARAYLARTGEGCNPRETQGCLKHSLARRLYRVLYREAHLLLEELTDATLDGTYKNLFPELTTVPLLTINDLDMRRPPPTADEDLLELIMRRYQRATTFLTSNRPVDDWSKPLGDTAAA